jgi:hypothetical protein
MQLAQSVQADRLDMLNERMVQMEHQLQDALKRVAAANHLQDEIARADKAEQSSAIKTTNWVPSSPIKPELISKQSSPILAPNSESDFEFWQTPLTLFATKEQLITHLNTNYSYRIAKNSGVRMNLACPTNMNCSFDMKAWWAGRHWRFKLIADHDCS